MTDSVTTVSEAIHRGGTIVATHIAIGMGGKWSCNVDHGEGLCPLAEDDPSVQHEAPTEDD